MSAIPASSVSLKTMADGTLRISFDIEPAQAQDAFRLFAAPGTQVAIAALRAGSFLEQIPDAGIPASGLIPPDSRELKPRPHMGDVCYRTVQWCADASFWAWINTMAAPGRGVYSAAQAKAWVCFVCGVESRKELDTNNEANKAWHRLIREPYRVYLAGRPA